jgi:L-alanine-DL-glutamate epimerase-like enolase superfamily enzyme
MQASWSRVTEMLRSVRAAIGPDIKLMVDVQYAFADVDEALDVLRTWEDFDLMFVETPLWVDDVAGHARLVREQSIPIAAGEWLTTHHEFRELIDRKAIDVAQPDIGRVGGLTEACRVARLAAERGVTVVPHLWKTGISIAAALHFAAVNSTCPFIEFLPAEASDSPIRRELLTTDFELVGQAIAVPDSPGLGVELDPRAVARFSENHSNGRDEG